ncbi:hypothetical protein [Actinomycetospora chibensis]|uniref:Uncharacterized protein n=1 Tax=Actinomycetospora chibensis TaxID=663606 RepID=A0ABV9RBS0_9PSEU|nr:hypothetical protein [Actinomycetospora chibensis]MDD7925540.1 hypothetical protein [Actinomycetospora chibensis]
MGVNFCPVCGTALDDAAFVQEYWAGEDRQFLCWCAACAAMSTVVLAAAVVSHEPEH